MWLSQCSKCLSQKCGYVGYGALLVSSVGVGSSTTRSHHCSIELYWLWHKLSSNCACNMLVYQSVTGNALSYIKDMLQPVCGLDQQT